MRNRGRRGSWEAAGPSRLAISLSEAAARLRVSTAEVEAMVAAGKLQTVGDSRAATGGSPCWA